MAQVKIYGLRSTLDLHKQGLSQAIHRGLVEALAYPADKQFHRFISLAPEDFVHPADRSDDYTIIEISMFEGRSTEAKKALVCALYANIGETCGISPPDIEITIFETPRENWCIRGVPGDELALSYDVQV
jgi:phenylpyruvate tautomerase PptA (4-oxalocrotonate tautomerase family)